MRVFITGVNSFVGRFLSQELVAARHEVWGSVRAHDREVPPGLTKPPFVSGDIGGTTSWRAALQDVDAIVHLAARVHVFDETSIDPAEAFWSVNVEGTRRLVQEAVAAQVKRIIFLSSVGIHPVPPEGQSLDEQSPIAPRNDYARSKWEAEQVLLAMKEEISVVILRAPMVYGPQAPGNFGRLVGLVKKGIPLPLGRITNARSMIYVRNLTHAISQCLLPERVAEQTFCVCDNEAVSTPTLIQYIAEGLGKAPRLLPSSTLLLRLGGKLIGRSKEIERLVGSLPVDDTRFRTLMSWTAPFATSAAIKASAAAFRTN